MMTPNITPAIAKPIFLSIEVVLWYPLIQPNLPSWWHSWPDTSGGGRPVVPGIEGENRLV